MFLSSTFSSGSHDKYPPRSTLKTRAQQHTDQVVKTSFSPATLYRKPEQLQPREDDVLHWKNLALSKGSKNARGYKHIHLFKVLHKDSAFDDQISGFFCEPKN